MTDHDESLLDCVCVENEASARALKVRAWDLVLIHLVVVVVVVSPPRQQQSHQQQQLTSCLAQVVIANDSENNEDNTDDGMSVINNRPSVSIHPLMYECLVASFAAIGNCDCDCDSDCDSDNLDTDDPSNSDVHVPNNDDSNDNNNQSIAVSVSPLSLPGIAMMNDSFVFGRDLSSCWRARKICSCRQLPRGSSISLHLVYIDEELHEYCCESDKDDDDDDDDAYRAKLQSILSFFLEGKYIMKGTTTILSTLEGMAIVTIDNIQETGTEGSATDDDIAYELSNGGNYTLHVQIDNDDNDDNNDDDNNINKQNLVKRNQALKNDREDNFSAMVAWQSDCPGYERLVNQLLQMVTLTGPAAPSGMLLTGSSQVGKTHLASCVAYRLAGSATATAAAVHWVSVQDLILQASWASESDLVNVLRPPLPTIPDQFQLLVLDDLNIFVTQETTLQEDAVSINSDPEMLVVQNSVLQIIDELASHKNGRNVAILGISQSTANLPPEFTRTGRLEKELIMFPPTQSQREIILQKLLPTLMTQSHFSVNDNDEKDTVVKKWAEALSPVTVGCVAGDLCRILAAAWTSSTARGWIPGQNISSVNLQWDDLQKAAQTYVPLQLESVDVCKPQLFLSVTTDDGEHPIVDTSDWAKIHELSWSSFGGYEMVKKRLLRTVVGPWRRFLTSIDFDDKDEPTVPMNLSPPPGVLFHGLSGNGKSFAAKCLASSLGLPMINVKAADVMDKWLGGSESIIRSLFTRARSAAPCVLFFDEIDAVATNRAGGDEGGTEVMSRLLSTLLNEMDGISSDKRKHSVLVIACTNRLEDLDAALLRPGRLEEHVELENPSELDIRAMLQLHLAKVPIAETIRLDDLAMKLAERRATCADVEGICHEACLAAVHRSTSLDMVLLQEDIEHALQSSRLT